MIVRGPGLLVCGWLLFASVFSQCVQCIDVKTANLMFEQAKRENEHLRKSYEIASTMCDRPLCNEVLRDFLRGESDYLVPSPAAKLLKSMPDRSLFMVYEAEPFALQRIHESLLRLQEVFGAAATSPATKQTASSAGIGANRAQQDEL